MAIPISLSAIVDELETLNSEFYTYVNRTTGEIITVSNEDLVVAETDYELDDFPAWQLDLLAAAQKILSSDEFVRLPTSEDIHEWSIMQQFCYTLESDRQRRMLLDQLHGKGAFRKFKDTVNRYNLQEAWFAYYKAALRQIAADFLDAEGIAYVA